MNNFILIMSLLASVHAWPDSDPVTACRAEHAADAEAHVACLEAALVEALGGETTQATGEESDASTEPVAPARDGGPTGLGAEQLRALPSPEEAAIDSVQVRIVASRYSVEGKGTFLMADGQVWRETMAAPVRWRLHPDQEYDARIERATLGGYRLHVDGIRGMMTVRRIQ